MNQKFDIKIFDSTDLISQKWVDFENVSFYHCFQSFDWVDHWLSTIGKKLNYNPQFVFVMTEENQILMILPLAIKRTFNFKMLCWVGGDYGCGLFSKDFYEKINKKSFLWIWKEILKKIKRYDIIYLSSQPFLINSFENPFIKYLNCYPHHSLSHQIAIDGDWKSLKIDIRKKLLKDTERQLNRLNKIGKIEFKVAESNNILPFTEKMIEQKSMQYDLTKVENQFKNESSINFYKNLKFINSQNLLIHVSVLFIDHSIIATHWGVIDTYNKIIYYLMPAYDNKWSKYSPGRIHMIELIKWCIKNDIKLFDMTGGNEPYKFEWGNRTMDLYNFLESSTIYGLILKWMIKYKYFQKRRIFAKR